ncbi:uncharacterized protein Dwil_GK19746 [Drosophila willistoni]|uniref:Glucose-methanol-choline oxidoreductase N-terminal domain-containing protein n=1 Tax=Drosophila willistoni TaxID=7260 RepID=B4MT96_DROWI|nr:uncharacterized protein Dwil_GK19746 [Drosophila willistoni]
MKEPVELCFLICILLTTLGLGESQRNVDNIAQTFKQLGLGNIVNVPLYSDVPRPDKNYDFIIVGAGAAGCTLAARLSENPKWQVYLIEAGGVENLVHQIPAMAPSLQLTASNWGYESQPQRHACYGMHGRRCALPRGKVLGGTSSINFMIYNRGNRRDFDTWSQRGNYGWSYKEVLPYFLRSESAQLHGLEHSPYHNHSGPLSVEDVRHRTQLAHAYIRAAQEAGHARTDYNGESQLGVSYVQANTLKGRRHSAFRAYIEPIRAYRKNLHILTLARVTRILIDEATKSAYGIELTHGGRRFQVKARKEVILSAGAFNSPQLLMLSGIGPEDNLKAIGIPIVKVLPVGRRMYDHMCHFGPTFVTNTTGQSLFTSNLLEGIKEAIRITKMPALRAIGTRLLERSVPGCEGYSFGSDDYWRCSIRTLSYTLHHQVATCRMGPESDPTSVVSPQLKVHGMRRLRVVDTSIIPLPPTAHTNAAAFMIGEKAADMIREDWTH